MTEATQPTGSEPASKLADTGSNEQVLRDAAAYLDQIETCAEAGAALLAECPSPELALFQWIALFVELLVTKPDLAEALHGDGADSDGLHAYFVDRLVPVCAMLLDAATKKNTRKPRVGAYGLMRGIGNLCIGAGNDPRYEPRKLVHALVSGVLAGAH
jgi:hypothetical protein